MGIQSALPGFPDQRDLLTSVDSGRLSGSHDLADQIACLAYDAMMEEVLTTPKPGLVDQANSGSHSDMNLFTFIDSAEAIHPWLKSFIAFGMKSAASPADTLLNGLRPLGIRCEMAMMAATGGVNTHKGMIFSLALVLSAAGRLIELEGKKDLTAEKVCRQVAEMTRGLVERELTTVVEPQTAGERLFCQFGLTGVRGEVESGFETIRQHSLPVLTTLLKSQPRSFALLQTLLHLMANNEDTNIVSRGGMLALQYTQNRAASLLSEGGVFSANGMEKLRSFDRDMVSRNLSPGGSADLLAVTYLLHSLENLN